MQSKTQVLKYYFHHLQNSIQLILSFHFLKSATGSIRQAISLRVKPIMGLMEQVQLESLLHLAMRLWSHRTPSKSPNETTNLIFAKTLYSALHIPSWSCMFFIHTLALEDKPSDCVLQSTVRSLSRRCSSISIQIPGMLLVFFFFLVRLSN